MATPPTTDGESETDHSQAEQPGPALLNERPLLGIFVHLFAMITGLFGLGFVIPGILYSVSDHEFTRENARNAFNWHLFYFAFQVTLLAFALVFVLGADALEGYVPDPLFLVPFALIFVGITLSFVLFVLTGVFGLVATGKAIFGDAWEYPIAPDIVD